MAGDNSQFSNLMEGDEVARFLQTFILPEKIRADAQSRNQNISYPQNTNDVLRDVKKIWDQKGFLSPAELRTELISHYTPNTDPAVKDFINKTELSRNKPEMVTGYLSKEHSYISTGLGHLYATETGRPIAMAEVDFSNMGGTNEEFKRRIAKEKGIDISAVRASDAEHMTDMAVRLLSDSMVESLEKELPKGNKIVPIRTGGDELRLLFTGIDDPVQLAKITEKMHAHIEYHVAAMGLQDHAHLKDPTNPVRNGFGAAIATRDMRTITDPTTVIQDADERIKAEKEKIGHLRLGTIDEKSETLKIEQAITDKKLTVPEGMTRKDFVMQKLNEERVNSGLISDALHTANPQRNKQLDNSLSGFKSHVEMTAAAMDSSPIIHQNLPTALANDNHATQPRPSTLPPLASIEDRRLAHASNFFAGNDIALSATERHFMNQSVKGLTSIDPSAQVMMPKDMIGLIETYAAEADEYRKTMHPDSPAVQDGLRRSGLSSVNDIAPHTMAVSFHNLAGLNNEHGHHNADLVLRTMGNDIIGKTLSENGFSANGKDAFSIAHHGGGNFSVIIAPSINGADGKVEFISPDRIKKIEQDISHKVADLNGQKVTSFLEARGVLIDAPTNSPVRNATFADIQDPKIRDHTVSPEIKGRVNGIHVAVASSPVIKGSEPFRGDAHIGQIRKEADVKLTAIRDQSLVTVTTSAPQEAHLTKSHANPPKTLPHSAAPIIPALAAAALVTAGTPEVKAAAKLTVHENHTRVVGSGIGVGMGVYGLAQKFGEDGTAKKDLANAETRNLAKAAIAADASGIIVDGADGLAALQKASKGLQVATKVSRVAAPVGAALTIASGVIDYKIAVKQKDAARAADAIGGSTGGFVGAAAGGLVGAKGGALIGGAIGTFFGGIGAVPGAAIGGFIGGIGGAITGAFAGAEVGKKATNGVVKDYLQKSFDEDKAARSIDILAKKSELKKALTPEISKDLKPAITQVARETIQDYKNESRKTAANETRLTPSTEHTRPAEDTKFAKSAPDLSSVFTKSASAIPTLSLVPKEPELAPLLQTAQNNKVLQTRVL